MKTESEHLSEIVRELLASQLLEILGLKARIRVLEEQETARDAQDP